MSSSGPAQSHRGLLALVERHADREKAVETLLAYASEGFTTFDTADIYGPSESILGDFRRRWVASQSDSKPLRFFTKYVTEDTGARSADQINSQSLRNLGVEALDMVQFHFWRLASDGSDTAFLSAGKQLMRLKNEGKIGHLSGCNMDAVNLKAMVDDGMEIEANQVQYSLLDRRPEHKLLEYCREQRIKLTIFGVVAGGLLSDSFVGLSKGEAQRRLDSVSRRMYWSSLQRWTQDWGLFQQLLQTLRRVGQRHTPALTVAAVASAWALRQLDELGAGGALIIGVRDAGHLKEHKLLLEGKASLTLEDMQEIAAILEKGSAPKGDVWHQERGWA
eukprot:CAMPEP_0183442608 /NCGR_PEP_ID=MMETSP0370-20130417/88812_1 /TAXON_ID=268820 /ORGANISM="Peridinium aciculiferum, Strain PAER-2" /LENGTH=333 /DNA_ID=CAMNT_0025632295 /DNA_START=157 /DNA_END=1159 /DNA_ORIENTATION=+